jgi:hypothetical protein
MADGSRSNPRVDANEQYTDGRADAIGKFQRSTLKSEV